MAQLIGYRRKEKTFALSALLSISAAISLTAIAHAVESWQSLKHDGEELAMQRKFRESTEAFEQALKLVPDTRENERVDMQLAAAMSYNSILEVDKAIAHLKDAAERIRKLKAQ